MTYPKAAWYNQAFDSFVGIESITGTNIPPMSTGFDHDIDALHEVFHEQTKYFRSTARGIGRTINHFVTDPTLIVRGASGRRLLDGFSPIPLEKPTSLDRGLDDCLKTRHSSKRGDLKGKIGLADLSTLLHHSLRACRSSVPDRAPHIRQSHRPYPSAGALFSSEFYVANGGDDKFVAHYDPIHHRLRRLPGVTSADVRAAEIARDDLPVAPIVITITSVAGRLIQKYGLRGYRLALIEAGLAIQNILLTATAMGLHSLTYASFYEGEIERVLGIDGVSECALAQVVVGQ